MSLFADTAAVTGQTSTTLQHNSSRSSMSAILITGLLGLGALALGSYHAWMGISSGSWQTADGTVLSSHVEERRSKGRRSRRGKTCEAKVRYEYSVEGRAYQSEQIRYGLYSTSFSSLADGVVRRYPKGRRVQVRYKPGAPRVAVLETGFHPMVWVPLGLGAVFLGVTILMLRRQASQPARPSGPPPYPPRQF